jgi:predicted nucleic-acid-binding Zn-ribbon protein
MFLNMNAKIKCPKCNSEQITANKKGFSGGKAVAGAIVAGPLGLAAGTLGSNKVKITCLNCGNEFYPGLQKTKKQEPLDGFGIVVFIVVFGSIMLFLFWILGII